MALYVSEVLFGYNNHENAGYFQNGNKRMVGSKLVALLLAAIVVLAVVALVILIQSPSPYSPSQLQRQSQQNQPSRAAENGSAARNQQKAGDGSEKQEIRNVWERLIAYVETREKAITAISTSFIAVFTIILAFATGFLYVATRNLVNEADDSAARQLRPYVYFHGPNTRPWPPGTPNRKSITIDYVNAGRTWARNLTAQSHIVRMQQGDTRNPFDTINWKQDGSIPIVLGPEQRVGVQFGEVSDAEWEQVKNGNLRIYLVALIKYVDGMTSPPAIRQTQLSRQLYVDIEGFHSFGYMPTHNCVDDDCPSE